MPIDFIKEEVFTKVSELAEKFDKQLCCQHPDFADIAMNKTLRFDAKEFHGMRAR